METKQCGCHQPTLNCVRGGHLGSAPMPDTVNTVPPTEQAAQYMQQPLELDKLLFLFGTGDATRNVSPDHVETPLPRLYAVPEGVTPLQQPLSVAHTLTANSEHVEEPMPRQSVFDDVAPQPSYVGRADASVLSANHVEQPLPRLKW